MRNSEEVEYDNLPRKALMSPSTSGYSTETPAKKMAAVARAKTPAKENTVVREIVKVLTDERLPDIEIALELITPELAEFYLSKRPNSQSDIKQRRGSNKLVDRYAEDMRLEQWLFTGDPLRFNKLGEFIDGQHRAEAVAQSGSSEMMVVIRGLDPETFSVFDTGRPRSFSDTLTSMGVPSVAMVSGVTRRVFHWRRGNYGVPNIGRIPNPTFLGVPASPGSLLETFKMFRHEIQAASRRGATLKAQFAPKTAAPAVVAFVYMVLARIDVERCEQFFHELQFGPAQPGPEYPIFVLRERLKRHLSASEAASPDWVWLHFFFDTWNKWYQGKSMGALRTPPRASYTHVARPIDPHAADRPEGWEPLGGVTA